MKLATRAKRFSMIVGKSIKKFPGDVIKQAKTVGRKVKKWK